ncbi:MAG: hypothetical protein SGILL_005727, partial [Bacillariaceae sp.]
DGKTYVWAATPRQDSAITVFDINNGALIGNFASCAEPHDLEYHPLRDEVWVRCEGDVNTTDTTVDPTHLDVFSASNPSGQILTNILAGERALQEGISSSGYSVIAPSLGDTGYITDSEKPNLYKVNLSTKQVVDTIALSTPAEAHGLYEAAFSPVNNHIFIRALMCCTCGNLFDDNESCRNPAPFPVSPTTGSGAGLFNVNGTCGRDCSGTAADTVGVYEFDPATQQVVATHVMAEGMGGDPYPSPDGKHIVMLGKNGGKTVRVLKAGSQGQPSTVIVDLELDFSREGYENKSVAKDFAFVQNNGKTLLVMPSGTSHDVAIVDFDDADFATTYVQLTDAPFENGAPHGRYRSVEWAVGTDYVWTNDSDLDEHYVIDVVQGKVVKVITGIRRSSMLSVRNYEHMQQEQMLQEVSAESDKSSTNGDDNDPVVIAAIVLASLALLVGLANLVMMNKRSYNASNAARASNKNFNDVEVASELSEQALPIEKLNDPRNDPLGVST